MQTTTQTLFKYWNEVRGERLAPRRFEIEPSRIGHILPETFVLEHTDEGAFRFRLAGTRICEQLGLELRGRELADIVDKRDRSALAGALGATTMRGGVLLLELEATSSEGRAVALEVVILPLVHTQETISRMLGGMALIEAPAWSGAHCKLPFRIISHESIWPDGRPYAVVQKMDRQTPFIPSLASARIVRSHRRQFRVFDGGLADRDGEKR